MYIDDVDLGEISMKKWFVSNVFTLLSSVNNALRKKYVNKLKRDRYMPHAYKLFYLSRIALALGDHQIFLLRFERAPSISQIQAYDITLHELSSCNFH